MVRSINFNNHFGNKNESTYKNCNLKVDNCVISNYNISNGKPSGGGYFDLMVHGKYATYNNERFKCDRTLSLNQKKYNIFQMLAKCDGDNTNLTQKDLILASFLPSFSWKDADIKSIKNNISTGEAIVTFNDGQVISFDFETKTENNKEQTRVEEEILKLGPGIDNNMSISDVHDINTVAEYTGIDADYIEKILVGIEGENNWPAMKAYYDGVADKKHPIGHLTIGFGHTNLAGAPKINKETVITEKQAYQILANDILNVIKLIQNKLGDLYNNAPQSIKNAMVDIAFNKGIGAIDKSLIANIKANYFHSAARRTWYDTNSNGLIKRNIYRFISAVRDLNSKAGNKQTISDAENAIKNFKKDHFEQIDTIITKQPDVKKAWNKMCDEKKVPQYRF